LEQTVLLKPDLEGFMSNSHLKTGIVSRCLTGLAVFLSVVNSIQAGLWLTNGPMLSARSQASATLLQNGKVLVAGGFGDNSARNTAELYDPTTGNWRPVGSLYTARGAHTATLLSNGKVLVAGGFNSTVQNGVTYLTSAELYDPVSESWTDTGPLQTARSFSSATLLLNGKVLVAGGANTITNTITAELYDPATGSWTPTANLNEARAYHAATLLPNGQVMVSGGTSNGFINPGTRSSIELYDPAQGKWTVASTMVQARLGHTATLLPNGKVLLAGGITNGPPQTPFSSAEIYDPVTGTNGPVASMHSTRVYHTATLLPGGSVLVIGGITDHTGNLDSNGTATNSTEFYNPSNDTWTATAALNTPRFGHRAVLLPSGQILAAGGATNEDNPGLSSTELFDPTIGPSTATWTLTGFMQHKRTSSTATLLPNGKVLVAGGENGNGTIDPTCELYDPVTGAWSFTGSINYARFNHTATLLANGKVLITGGSLYDFSGTPISELYDPGSGIWTTNSIMFGFPQSAHTATLLRNGKVLVAGYTSPANSAQLYDPISNTWTATGPMIIPRMGLKAVLLPNGKVLAVSGQYNSTNISSAEIYDPATGQWSAAGATRTFTYDFTAAALLPSGKVLVSGADNNGAAIADLFDSVTGTWNTTGAPNTNHFQPNLVVLPTGNALLVGEGGDPEIYDPAIGLWTTTPPMNEERQHDCAVLLPDGRVLDIGGDVDSNLTLTATSSAEIYDAGLLATNAPRPTITFTSLNLHLGDSLTVIGTGFRGVSGASGGNWMDSSTDYPLVQLRSIESGQATFLLTTNWSTNSFTSLPVWNFPPGQALASVFVNGIQSTSSVVNISVPTPVVTTLANPQVSVNGAFQFFFTNTPGATLGALTATNLALPASSWTPLSSVTEIAPGKFTFTDPGATNDAQRFYQIFAP
jgi:N-acetylneuraminic acid mutarotase